MRCGGVADFCAGIGPPCGCCVTPAGWLKGGTAEGPPTRAVRVTEPSLAQRERIQSDREARAAGAAPWRRRQQRRRRGPSPGRRQGQVDGAQGQAGASRAAWVGLPCTEDVGAKHRARLAGGPPATHAHMHPRDPHLTHQQSAPSASQSSLDCSQRCLTPSRSLETPPRRSWRNSVLQEVSPLYSIFCTTRHIARAVKGSPC